MHAFTVHPQKTPAPPPADRPRRPGRWLAALALLLLAGLILGALRPDPLDRVKALQKELFTAEAKNLPPDQRQAKFEELRTAMKALSDDRRWELAAPMRERQKAELDRYFALSPKEKTSYLDERINRSEQVKKDFQKKAGTRGGGPPGGGGGGKGPPSPANIDHRRKEMLDRTTPEERAKRDAFRRDLENRRKQRGLPPGGRG
jgi:hypothetical protein